MNFPALGIRRKVALTTLLSLLPLLLIGVALSVHLISGLLWQDSLRQEEIAFTSIDSGLEFEANMWGADVRFIAILSAIPEILRAREHGGIDPVSGMPLDKVLQRLQGALSHFIVTQKLYDQVRLIDKSGLEVIRVNLAGGRGKVLPPPNCITKETVTTSGRPPNCLGEKSMSP